MSGQQPFQRWTYLPGGRYTDGRGHETPQGQQAVSSSLYAAQDLPRVLLFPHEQNHERAIARNPGDPRLSVQGLVWDNGIEPKHGLSPTTTGSLAQYSLQRPTMTRNVESAGSTPFPVDASTRSRGSVGSAGRMNDVDSQYSDSSATFPSPVQSDRSPGIYPQMAPLPTYKLPILQRHNAASIPSGFENLLHRPSPPSPPPRRTPGTSRYRLSIRQQPIAARACGAGDRDRRSVDPPPILQMLLTDFDPGSETDRAILQDPRLTVGCLLYPVHETSWSSSSETGIRDSNTPGQSTPLLSGKAFVSPFCLDEEPDPATAPSHLSSDANTPETRAIRRRPPPRKTPATFFIFSDLSVRTAGLYRLQFRLMNWGAIEDTGQPMPILAEAQSEPFRVYPAKDFPGMRDSSALAIRLKELGFVELKTRGKGVGKGRRVASGKSEPRNQEV